MAASTSIDEYIGSFPPEIGEKLTALQSLIRSEAPQAVEKISYAMPTFFLNGNLVHFAAYAGHIGFYPTPSAIVHFAEELKPYQTSKGAVRFPLDLPLPTDLIRRMVRFRVQENSRKKKRKIGILFLFTAMSCLCSASSIHKEKPWPEKVSVVSWQEVLIASLPPTLVKAMKNQDEFIDLNTDELPPRFLIFRIDLDGDGSTEYLVQSHQSYSGGPASILFQERQGKFVCLAYFQGIDYFGPRVNGYNQIICIGKAGAKNTSMLLYQYGPDRYHLVRHTRYTIDPDGNWSFMGEEVFVPKDVI